MIPQMTAAAMLSPTRRASTYAPTPHRMLDSMHTRFAASSGLPVSQITGAANNAMPITFSPYADFEFGARYFFKPLDLWYSLIKSFAFAGAVTIIPCYIGFNTQQGAEGVGRATTQAVVSASVTILLLDTILTKLILGTAK